MDSSVLLAALGAIIGVIALMYLAYKGLATVLYTTIAVVIVCLFSGINLIEGIFKATPHEKMSHQRLNMI